MKNRSAIIIGLAIFLMSIVPSKLLSQDNPHTKNKVFVSEATKTFFKDYNNSKNRVVFGLPITSALRLVEERHGIVFIYDVSLLKNKTVKYKEALPENVLDAARDIVNGYSLRAVRLNDHSYAILPVVSQDEKAVPKKITNIQQETITGTVTDAQSGASMPGVNVVVKGTMTGTATNNKGKYSLNVPSAQDTLVFSYIGYNSRVIPINGRSVINVTLKPNIVQGQQMVVVGYGMQRKSDLTGSISTVQEQKLSQVSVTSLDQGLQGQVSGLFVKDNSGQPGGGTTIRIRGVNSINAGNEPLFVVDGIPIYNNTSSLTAGVTQGANLNPLAMIDPNDIKSIQVLKDASATAIYGARGANGVILITTKEGKAGYNHITINSSIGIQKVAKMLPLMNATQYAKLVNDAYVNYGDKPYYTQQQIASMGTGTNWQKEIFRTAPISNTDLTFTGGSNNITYSITGNYMNQEGIVMNSNYNRMSLQSNIDGQLSKDFKVGLHSIISRVKSDLARSATNGGVNSGAILGAIEMNPVMSVYQSDGSYTLQNLPGYILGNPVAQLNELTNQSISSRYLGNMYAQFSPIQGLVAKVSINADIYNNKENYYAPKTILQGQSTNGSGSVGYVKGTTWLNDNTLTYSRDLGENSFKLMVGFTTQGSSTEYLTASTTNFSTDILGYHNLGAASVTNFPANSTGQWDIESFIGRLNYNYKDKYLLTITGRRDGSSRFGAGKKYAFFPSAALAWKLTNENFLKRYKFISNLKLRVSYGLTGNQEIGNYNSIGLLSVNQAIIGNGIATGFVPNTVANPDLKWESTSQFDIGLDGGLFNDHLNVTADYYYKKTKNLLLNVPLPWSSGFSSALENLGSIQNRGIELSLGYKNMSGIVRWEANVNFSKNVNKILSLGPIPYFLGGTYEGHLKIGNEIMVKPGLPIGTFYGYVADGIFQNQQQVDNSGQAGARVGGIRYKDINGDGKITSDDRTELGSAQPKFQGGFSGNIYFKNLELDAVVSYVYGNKVFNMNDVDLTTPTGGHNVLAALVNRWTPQNHSNVYPAANEDRALVVSNRFIKDGSYIKLENITLKYNIPTRLIKSFTADQMQIYVSGQNLLMLTKYDGYSPEANKYGQSNLDQGIDYGVYPPARIYKLGLRIGF